MNKISNEKIIEFNQRFANGEQYIAFDSKGEIIIEDKTYYWESRMVFNLIRTIVDKYSDKLDVEQLYGKGGLVELLGPFQKAYNQIKNKELEYINRLTNGVLCVEDGSVDIDELQEDGISTNGQIIVYRQGAEEPRVHFDTLNTDSYLSSAVTIQTTLEQIAADFYLANAGKHKKCA